MMLNDYIVNRVKWLYAFNGGGVSKQDCVKQALKEQDIAMLVRNLGMFDITLDDYIGYLVKHI